MANPDSPFVPGAKVAMRSGGRWGAAEWKTFEVEKQFKNGRFTLKDRDGQWNAHPPIANGYGDKCWHAYRAGESRYGDGTVLIWDSNSDAQIKEGFAIFNREKRLKKLQARFERLKYEDISDEALESIETALAVTNGQHQSEAT